jgi:DNA-binding MarR family transcriptional regulator
MDSPSARRPRRVAFLLAQVGALSSAGFAERTRELGLSPADAGVLRLLAKTPGLSQRALADRLGAVPSRVVALIDSLEQRSLVERQRSASDRRNYELRLTSAGEAALGTLRAAAEEHEEALLTSLSPTQQHELEALLRQVADSHGLDVDLRGDTALSAND